MINFFSTLKKEKFISKSIIFQNVSNNSLKLIHSVNQSNLKYLIILDIYNIGN